MHPQDFAPCIKKNTAYKEDLKAIRILSVSSCLLPISQVALEGLRPTIPPGISPHICKLMRLCMNEDPAKRPKFDMIVPILEKMQDK